VNIFNNFSLEIPDVKKCMGLRITDWGDVHRLDLNQLGAVIPTQLRALATEGGWADELKKKWGELQVDGILEAMENSAEALGGNFPSFAEWTVVYNELYSPLMRTKRKEKFGDGYRAAISTLKWLSQESGLSARIQANAYIPKSRNSNFRQVMWRPACMADYEMFVVAPAVSTYFGGISLLHVAGMLGMDSQGLLIHTEHPEKQIHYILENIISVFEEAGGTRKDVVRLRPFAQTPEIAAIIRRKVKELWKGSIEPTVFMSDGMRFGGPADKQYAEIQAFGILKGDADILHQKLDITMNGSDEDTFAARSTITRDFEYIQASEIRAGQSFGPETESNRVVNRIEEFISKAGLCMEDICNIIVYAGTLEAAREMEEAIGKSLIPRNMVHLVPCPQMYEMGEYQIKAEVSARRLLK